MTPAEFLNWIYSISFDHVLVWDEFGQRYEDTARQYTPRSDSTPENQLAKYNARDTGIDPAWAQTFFYLNSYFKQGQFAPGAPTATLEVMAQANAQWKHDSAPGIFEKVMQAAALAAVAYAGWSFAMGGLAEGAGAASLSASEIDAIVAYADAADAVALADAAEIAAITAPETVAAAASVAAGTATATEVATVAKTGLTAAEVLGTAKTVLGAAGTVATIAKMTTGATRINPASGAPYGLPPGYQPVVTPGSGGMGVDYSGIIKQLALPAVALVGLFLLKG